MNIELKAIDELIYEVEMFEQAGVYPVQDFIDNLKILASKVKEETKLEGCMVVPEWISLEDQQPGDGQKCLVVFESGYSPDEACRYMEIDTFIDGEFESIINYEDMVSSVGMPEGSTISKLCAICWYPTELSNKPLTFDQFYVEAKADAEG